MKEKEMSKANIFRGTVVIGLILIAIGAVLPISAAPLDAPALQQPQPTQIVPGNLLANPSFELPYTKQCCQTDLTKYFPNTPIDEIQVPHGWFGWWTEPDTRPDLPARCDRPDAPRICIAFHRPEFRDAAAGGGGLAAYANRIRSGANAQKYFTFYSTHEAGMYQRVTGLRAGQKLQFAAHLMAWSTHEAERLESSGQQTMNLKVGIDPTGGTNPFSSNIVWSKPGDSYDAYKQFAVEAVAQGTAVTVFTYSRPIYPLQHNDVYVDDAALVVVGTGAVTVRPGTGATGGVIAGGVRTPVSPFPDTTVDKDGNILYIIQTGDTAWSLAQRFNTTVSQLQAWNKDKFPSIEVLRLGKTIIVGKVKVKK
jgi:hypothetical protein